MTQLSEEQQERVRQIREGGRTANAPEIADVLAIKDSDIDFLLSLLDSDSQAAGDADTPSECFDRGYLGGSLQGHADGYELGYHNAATAMRDKCVEKVREMVLEWRATTPRRADIDLNKPSRELRLLTKADAGDEIITAIQSLTLDQVKPGEM